MQAKCSCEEEWVIDLVFLEPEGINSIESRGIVVAGKKAQSQEQKEDSVNKLLLCGTHAAQMFPGKKVTVLLGDNCRARSARARAPPAESLSYRMKVYMINISEGAESASSKEEFICMDVS